MTCKEIYWGCGGVWEPGMLLKIIKIVHATPGGVSTFYPIFLITD
jgi:hypothetical protein